MIVPVFARGEVWTEHRRDEDDDRAGSTGRPRRAARWSGSRPPSASGDEQVARLPARRRGQPWAEAVCPTGEDDGYVWTRKRAGRGRGRRADRRARGSAARRAGSRTSRAAITRTTPSGTGRPASARRPTAARSAWNLVSGINDPPERSERAIWVDGEPQRARPGRASTGSRRSSFDDGGRLEFSAEAERAQGGAKPFVKLQLPPAVRHLHRDASPAGSSSPRPRRDGAPRRPLVGRRSARRARDRPTPPASATAAPRRRANSYWLRPSRVSSATSAGTASSSSGVGASARDLGAASTPRDDRSQPSVGR